MIAPIYFLRLFLITSLPITDRCLLLTTKRCVIIRATSGASAPYIPHNSILLQTTDAFLPSSPRSTSNHQAFHRLCYRTSQIVGTYRALKTAVASQCLSKNECYLSAIPQYLLTATAHFLLKCPYNHTGER